MVGLFPWLVLKATFHAMMQPLASSAGGANTIIMLNMVRISVLLCALYLGLCINSVSTLACTRAHTLFRMRRCCMAVAHQQ